MITRHEFLKYKFPIYPYCKWERGPSTEFNESFHCTNSDTSMTLNFWWRCDGIVNVCFYDNKNSKSKKAQTIIDNASELEAVNINKICGKYLK